MATADREALRDALTKRLDAFSDRLGRHQQLHLDSLLERRRYLTADNALFDPLGHPVVVIGSWVSRTTDPLRDAGLDVAESSLMGYLHVRLQDDHLDDGTASSDAVMMLGDALFARHSALLARHVSSAVFWGAFEQLWVDYGESMLLERQLQGSGTVRTAATFEQLLDRSRPLAIPGLAVLAMEDRESETEHLMNLVSGIVRSGQLVTDLIDAPTDLAAGRHTWIVERLGGRRGAAVLRRSMVREFDAITSEASTALETAAAAAVELGADVATRWIDERRQRLIELQTTFFGEMFSPLLGRVEE